MAGSNDAIPPEQPKLNEEPSIMPFKGDLIGAGSTGIAQLTTSGEVIKSPWKGERGNRCKKDMSTEARVYQMLGRHSRLVDCLDWDPEECCLTLEYMPNGSLWDYLENSVDGIPSTQRLVWAKEAAEGVELLHSANVIHCDVGPGNFLVGSDMSLRIADFSGSCLNGSKTSTCPGTRFTSPTFDWVPTFKDDIFSLGATIYTIITGHVPFGDLASPEVESRYAAHSFPDTAALPCGVVIQGCWDGSITSAQHVVKLVDREISKAGNERVN